MTGTVNISVDFAGLGLCQNCAVECRAPDTNDTTYKLCCEDGPVFDSRGVVL